MTGYVKNIVGNKNYGFIVVGKKEYFFHKEDYKDVWEDLIQDFSEQSDSILVEFEEAESRKGLRAADVRRV